MVIIMKPQTPKSEIDRMEERLINLSFDVHRSQGENYTILGLIGDTTKIDVSQLEANEYVERIIRVQHPIKRVSRSFQPNDTVIDIAGHKVGRGNLLIIAGPCAVESQEQVLTIAKDIKKHGAQLLRGGAYKPRTCPYSFQGLEEEGLKILLEAKKQYGLPVVTECVSQTLLS